MAKRVALLATLPEYAAITVGSSGGTSGKECAIAVSLCAPQTQRVYSVSATRNQKWGEIPEPTPQIVRTSGSGSTAKITNVETLISKEFLGETPVLRSDGITRDFTVHARYVYGLSNPWRGTEAEGGGDEFETLPVGESPIDKATAANNAIIVRGDVSTLSALFSASQYG